MAERMKGLLADLAGLFDEVRIVEAGSGRVCLPEEGGLAPTGPQCGARWHRGDPAGCCAQEACRSGQRRVKLEYADERCYFVIAQPVSVEGRACALELITDITARTVTDDGLAAPEGLVQALTRQLETISEREAFTGLYSRAHAVRDVERRLRAGGRLYLGLFDLDDFKYINDFYGHVQGDSVLQKFAGLLQQTVSGGGYAARVGGDEFVVVFAGGDGEACLARMEAVRRQLGEHQFRVEEMSFRATVSYGLAEVGGAGSFAQALALAERQLNAAREAAR